MTYTTMKNLLNIALDMDIKIDTVADFATLKNRLESLKG